VTVNFVATDAEGSSAIAVATVEFNYEDFTTITDRRLFYNQSGTATRYDRNNLAINSLDDAAIATDKTAYLWEGAGAATFANVSSYSKGINGYINLTTAPAAPEAEVFAGDEYIVFAGDEYIVFAGDEYIAGDSGVASALTAPAITSGDVNRIPGWLANRLGSIDLNSGIPAKVFQHLHDANTPGTRALLQKIDAVAHSLGLDDGLLDSLLADLGLHVVAHGNRQQTTDF